MKISYCIFYFFIMICCGGYVVRNAWNEVVDKLWEISSITYTQGLYITIAIMFVYILEIGLKKTCDDKVRE